MKYFTNSYYEIINTLPIILFGGVILKEHISGNVPKQNWITQTSFLHLSLNGIELNFVPRNWIEKKILLSLYIRHFPFHIVLGRQLLITYNIYFQSLAVIYAPQGCLLKLLEFKLLFNRHCLEETFFLTSSSPNFNIVKFRRKASKRKTRIITNHSTE